MNYFGSGELPNTTADTLIHVTRQLGWKCNILSCLMIDVSTGYKFILDNTGNYQDIENYGNSGFRLGFSVYIFLNKIKRRNNDESRDWQPN
jgi:hypothetical protein